MNPKKKKSETSESEPKSFDLKLDSKLLGDVLSSIGSTITAFRIGDAIDRLAAALLTHAYLAQHYYLPGEVLMTFNGFVEGIKPKPKEEDGD